MFHKNLDHLISERKVNKTDLSRQLGIARSTLDGWLKGKTQMPADKIQQVAKYLGVSVGFLFEEKEEKDKSLQKELDEQRNEIRIINKEIRIINEKMEDIAKSLQIKIS